LARCFLRLANQPNFALDRLSGYEVAQSGQLAPNASDRRTPQRECAFRVGGQQKLPTWPTASS